MKPLPRTLLSLFGLALACTAGYAWPVLTIGEIAILILLSAACFRYGLFNS